MVWMKQSKNRATDTENKLTVIEKGRRRRDELGDRD